MYCSPLNQDAGWNWRIYPKFVKRIYCRYFMFNFMFCFLVHLWTYPTVWGSITVLTISSCGCFSVHCRCQFENGKMGPLHMYSKCMQIVNCSLSFRWKVFRIKAVTQWRILNAVLGMFTSSTDLLVPSTGRPSKINTQLTGDSSSSYESIRSLKMSWSFQVWQHFGIRGPEIYTYELNLKFGYDCKRDWYKPHSNNFMVL